MALSKLGRYDIVRVLGKGAMGTVYEAYDPDLARRVAIKTIAVQGLTDEGVRDYEIRFRTEAHSCARLQHPHIVSVYDAGRDGDTAYLVMEYVEGHDLKYHLDQGERFTLDQTLRIMRELLSALAYAHAQNVVHRDVKPGNLLIEADGRVKLTDFGVARIQDAGDASAGIVLYQLLTARQPFVGDSEFAIIAQIVGVDPPAPSTIHPALPVAIDSVVACALAKSREQRFPTAQAFDDALALACGQVNDRSTAPPPGAIGQGSGATPARTASSSSGPAGVATVTQELELVYWKDVRDSDDALDLQGFLDRFPNGIYADLARRRLRKFGVVFLGEQTTTRVEPRVGSPGMDADPAPESVTQLAGDRDQGLPARRRTPRLVAGVVMGIAVVLAAATGLGWWFSGPPSTVSSLAQTTEPLQELVSGAAPQPTPTASDAAVAAVAPIPAADPAIMLPQPEAHQVDMSGGAAPPTMPPDPRSSTNAKASSSATRAAAATVANSTSKGTGTKMASTIPAEVGGPEQACADRVLLGYQICLNQQCAKPKFAGHPLCQQRRAADQAIRRQQNNRQ